MGLKIFSSKTKAIHASYKMKMNDRLMLHVCDIEWVNSWIYLGSWLTAGGSLTKSPMSNWSYVNCISVSSKACGWVAGCLFDS